MCDLFAVADLVYVHMVCVTLCIPSIYEVVGETQHQMYQDWVSEGGKQIYLLPGRAAGSRGYANFLTQVVEQKS